MQAENAVCCRTLQCVTGRCRALQIDAVCVMKLGRPARAREKCSELQCFAVCGMR